MCQWSEFCHLAPRLIGYTVLQGVLAQGPFSLKEMKQWNQYGYFRPELLMRSNREDSFQPLREMCRARGNIE